MIHMHMWEFPKIRYQFEGPSHEEYRVFKVYIGVGKLACIASLCLILYPLILTLPQPLIVNTPVVSIYYWGGWGGD